MTGVVVLVAVVLRWIARGLLRVAEWLNPVEPVFFELVWPEDDRPDAQVIPLYGRSRRA